jgi:iron-sulfur cluster assembly protein
MLTPPLLPVQFSPSALQAIQHTFQSQTLPPSYLLRIGLRGAGCGASYLIGLDKPNEHDDIFETDGIKIAIDRRHLLYLFGVEVGYEDGDDGQGFFFQKEEKK